MFSKSHFDTRLKKNTHIYYSPLPFQLKARDLEREKIKKTSGWRQQ